MVGLDVLLNTGEQELAVVDQPIGANPSQIVYDSYSACSKDDFTASQKGISAETQWTAFSDMVLETAGLNVPLRDGKEIIVVDDEPNGTNPSEVYEITELNVASNTPGVTENVTYQKTYGLDLVEVPQLSYSLPRRQVVGNVLVNDNSSDTAAKKQAISSGSSASKGEEKEGKVVKQKKRELRKHKSRDESVVDGAAKKPVTELVIPAQISLFSDWNENVVMNSEATVTTKKTGDVSEILVCSETSNRISSEAQAPLSVRHPNNGRRSPSVMAVASAESSSTLRKAWIL